MNENLIFGRKMNAEERFLNNTGLLKKYISFK